MLVKYLLTKKKSKFSFADIFHNDEIRRGIRESSSDGFRDSGEDYAKEECKDLGGKVGVTGVESMECCTKRLYSLIHYIVAARLITDEEHVYDSLVAKVRETGGDGEIIFKDVYIC